MLLLNIHHIDDLSWAVVIMTLPFMFVLGRVLFELEVRFELWYNLYNFNRRDLMQTISGIMHTHHSVWS